MLPRLQSASGLIARHLHDRPRRGGALAPWLCPSTENTCCEALGLRRAPAARAASGFKRAVLQIPNMFEPRLWQSRAGGPGWMQLVVLILRPPWESRSVHACASTGAQAASSSHRGTQRSRRPRKCHLAAPILSASAHLLPGQQPSTRPAVHKATPLFATKVKCSYLTMASVRSSFSFSPRRQSTASA